MLKPKAALPHHHWDSLSDEQLLDLELQVDDPRTLPGLVFEIPEGEEEPHVEFKYDLRGQEIEEFSCVHGHHRHKAGFVIRKGGARFMVGWQCGKTIYGEDFDRYTADYDAAVNRRDALVRIRDLRQAIERFKVWVEQIDESGAIRAFAKLRGTLNHQMPWVYDHLPAMSALDARVVGPTVPRHLCSENTDIKLEFGRLMTETAALLLTFAGDPQKLGTALPGLRTKVDGLANRGETIVNKLDNVVQFFQPAVLDLIVKHANEHDNPKRRRYQSGLLSLMVRGIDKSEVHLDPDFKVPSRQPIEALRKAAAA